MLMQNGTKVPVYFEPHLQKQCYGTGTLLLSRKQINWHIWTGGQGSQDYNYYWVATGSSKEPKYQT